MTSDANLLIGRISELEHLKQIQNSNEAEFVVVYGRRRVGKTFLINTFYKENFAFKLTGLAKRDSAEQLENFRLSLNRYGNGKTYPKPKTWYAAFEMLRDLLENSKITGKKVVFIDELPWMDSRGSNLVPALEHFWNDWGTTQSDLTLIVCGSATSWITKKILKNRGGLHNRVTQKIYLHPFTLKECKEYIISRDLELSDKEIAECYMIFGGIPFYLKHLKRGLSLSQNVDSMLFASNGLLHNEFEELYASLFEQSNNYIKVVETLSKINKGLTREELLAATKMESSGYFSTLLQDLIDCEFIRSYKDFGKSSRGQMFQLIDPFTHFYYKFIKKYGTFDKPFWQFQIGTHQHDAWAGLAFEQLCLIHLPQIENALGISGIITQAFSWVSDKNAEEKAQIDLVIKRADKVINVCEMKFCETEYELKKRDYENMERKIRAFKSANGLHCAIHPILVTPYGLKQNQYSHVFQKVILLEDLMK